MESYRLKITRLQTERRRNDPEFWMFLITLIAVLIVTLILAGYVVYEVSVAHDRKDNVRTIRNHYDYK